jgi:hypothetical protein
MGYQAALLARIQLTLSTEHNVAKVLMELIADERIAGNQHSDYGFKLSADAKGDRILGVGANGSAWQRQYSLNMYHQAMDPVITDINELCKKCKILPLG